MPSTDQHDNASLDDRLNNGEPSLFEQITGVEAEEIGADESITEPFDPTLIRVGSKTLTLDLLVSRLRQNEFNLAPDFQRKAGIWTEGAQSRLIESILIRIPLPAFYIDASDDEKWVVVDGLQRLSTLKRFVVDNSLKLTDLEFLKSLEGKRYKDLSRTFQRRIEETQATVYLIEPGTPPEVKFNIFKRINTGGLPLSLQEIRHALNQGRATKFLKMLADSDEFKIATDYSVRDERMADREFVLRFLAFVLFPYTNYRSKDFDSFLNDRMAGMNKMSDEELKKLEQLFQRAMKAAYVIFERDAFRKRYDPHHARFPVNKALFETWSTSLARLTDDQLRRVISRRESLKEKFMTALVRGGPLDSAISTGTGDVRKVKLRFSAIEALVQEVAE